MDKITAIVPVRRENGELKNRNTLPFSDSNLLVYKIRQLKKVSQIDEIIVSTEDQEMYGMAKNEDVSVLKRPEKYADAATPFSSFVEYLCKQVEGDNILWTCVTSPFVTAEIYSEAILTYYEKIKYAYDSLIAVQVHKRYILDKNGSFNYKRGMGHRYSEKLSTLYLLSNGIAIAPREKMIEWKYCWGHVPFMYEVDKKVGLEIRDRFDYDVALYLKERETI